MNSQTLTYKGATEDYFRRNCDDENLLIKPPDAALVLAFETADLDPRGISVLEVGCGAPRNLLWLQRQFACEGVGVEPSEQVVGRLNEEFPSLAFRAGWSYELPCESNSFDLVLIYGVLSIVERDRVLQSIGEALRVTRRWLMIGEYVALAPFRMAYKHHADSFCYHTDYEPIVLQTGVAACRFRQTVVHESLALGHRVRTIDPLDKTHDRDRFKTCIFEKCLSPTPLKSFADFPSA